VREVVFE
jgi:hypothetical protein